MITVAGVTFSITMVAVTQTSAQYSPRVLRNFMRDRLNQAVLGAFVGIFVYCLVVLRTIRAGETSEFVPSLAVFTAVVLALLGVAVLIAFVHHIATTLQASTIVARITRDTRKVIDLRFPEALDHDPVNLQQTWVLGAVASDAWRAIPAPRTGYIQHYDREALSRIAVNGDLIMRLTQPTGEFVVEGRPIAWFAGHPLNADGRPARVWRIGDVARTAAKAWVIGTHRTLDHDPVFGFRQLVDVAVKALSPSVNDSTTALTCIDHLGALLIGLAGRRLTFGVQDAEGQLRLITAEPDFGELVAFAVDPIRQHARGDVGVLERLLTMLGDLATVALEPTRHRAIVEQLDLVHAATARTVPNGHDRMRLDEVARRMRVQAAEGVAPGG